MKNIYLIALLLIVVSCVNKPPLGKDFYCDQEFLNTRSHLTPSKSPHKIVGRSPSDLLHALSVGINNKSEIVKFYSTPNQKHNGDLVMGFVDKNTKQTYMNLGNNATASGNAIMRIDAYLRQYRSSADKNYAKSISKGAVESWYKFSSINGSNKTLEKCVLTQDDWNKQYTNKNNHILKRGASEIRKIEYTNKLFVTRNDLGGF